MLYGELMKVLKFPFLFFLFFLSCEAFSQNTGTLSGFVYDNKDGEALIGANVYVNEAKQGGTTNSSGYFAIPNVPYGEYHVSFSYIGYTTQTVKVTLNREEASQLNIHLNPQSMQTSEVVVVADSVRIADKLYEKPVSKIELTSKQVNQIPRFIEADLLRALQTLPGITALSDFSSALYVRGGTPDQNLYMIDGTDVYNPEHAFGIFSTFNTNAIKKVEISKGGFGAEYGGRLSSVLDVTNLDGNRNEFEGVVNISLLSASTTLQMPLGSIGSISGSIRRTYIDQTYAKWVKEIPAYYFYDGNLKAFFELGEKDKLTLSYFSGKDNLDFKVDKNKPSIGFLYYWGNQTASINWKHIFSPKLFSSFWTTYSGFYSNFNFETANFSEKNEMNDVSLKGKLEYYASNSFNLKFGFEQKFLRGLLQQDWESGKVDVNKQRTHTMAYVSSIYKPDAAMVIETGLRYNYFNSDKDYTNFEPRFSIKYRLDEYSNLKFAAGNYHQYLNRIPRLFFASIWTTADEYTKESSSNHHILGYQREVGMAYEFETEVYYKTYTNLYAYNQLVIAEVAPDSYEDGKPVYGSTKGLFNRGDGKSYGLEMILKKDAGTYTGWISYSLSNTEYTFDNINQGKMFIPRHSRTSVVNAVLNLDWNNFKGEMFGYTPEPSDRKWLLTFNFIYSTGQPITVPASAYYINSLPDWNNVGASGEGTPGYSLYPSAINKYRLPAYIRLDMSLTYEINYGSWTLAPYFQAFNIGNRKNVWFIDYKEEAQNGKIIQTVEETHMLPILPSIGVNIKF